MVAPAFTHELVDLIEQAKQQYPDCMTSDQAFGAIVSCLSVPDALTPADILDLLLNGEEEAAEAYLQHNPSAELAWASLIDSIKTYLQTDETYLHNHYALSGNEPSAPLADWCDGYLQAYLYCEAIWEEVFSTLKQADDDEELSDIDENFEVLLKMISSFSNWKEALIAEPSLGQFADNMAEIHDDLFNGVNYYFHFGQDMLTTWESIGAQTQKPFIQEVKIGRNDPCFCGSGKKYKQCCLN